MLKSPFIYIAIATLILLALTITSVLDFDFNWVFYLTVFGQVFLLIMVYKILTDDYDTEKTFNNFYEDRPIETAKIKAENEKFR